jgi:non-canonical purine NTP pyrophosphatase (RdgB/HAM1 family)
MKKLYLVTGNQNKAEEWRELLPPEIDLDIVDVDLVEIQSADSEEIITDKVKRAYEAVGKPVIVEDVEAGLEKLNGLPGPFIKYFIKNVGSDALYQLAGREGEKATVACTIGYYDGSKLITVKGEVSGTVVAPRVTDGFGFNITFVPDGETETFAEMSKEKKNTMSHRSKAIHLFVDRLEAEGIIKNS